LDTPRGLQVADADPQVVDPAVGNAVLAVVAARLDAVASAYTSIVCPGVIGVALSEAVARRETGAWTGS
jgi:hypothetical protein